MIFPADAAAYVGKMVMVRWQGLFGPLEERAVTFSGGRVTHVDDTYIYIQPIAESSRDHGRPRVGPRWCGQALIATALMSLTAAEQIVLPMKSSAQR